MLVVYFFTNSYNKRIYIYNEKNFDKWKSIFFSVESIYIYIYTEDWNRCLNLFIVHLIPLSFS